MIFLILFIKNKIFEFVYQFLVYCQETFLLVYIFIFVVIMVI